MAYDRYDRGDHRGRRDDERGFFERAGDEISSWFGDDDRERRWRDRERMNRGDWNRDSDRGRYAIGGWGDESSIERDPEYSRGWNRDREPARWRDEQQPYQPMSWTSSNRSYASGGRGYDRDLAMRGREDARSSGWGDYDRDFGPRGYGSGRSRNTGPSYGDRSYGAGAFSGNYDRSQSEWARDDYRGTSYAGSTRGNDRHYDAWRQRQLNELDRDYAQYCRERQDRFESDFGGWREERMSKRRHLSSIREHMDVVGSDGERIGKVDCVKGDHIVLTKSDSPDNRHHSIDCSMIETVEGDQVRLDRPGEEAKSRWDDAENRGFIGRGPDHEGPNLERSFSGTYEN